MAGRLQQLDSSKGGINRLRVKGGADKNNLYDLVNGYVDSSGSAQSRDGTGQDAELESGTIGLCAFNGELVVFATSAKTVPAGYVCEIIVHPTDPDLELVEIHYAGPFLGFLYIVAEYSDGSVHDYWLQRRDAWQANTFYNLGAIVEPTVRNGFAYRAHRIGDPGVVWAPDVPRTIGDVVEPTTPNGYEYTVTNTVGASPKSGKVEPTWPTEDGATVDENTDLSDGSGGGSTAPPSDVPPPDVVDRYKNPGGNRPTGGIYGTQAE
jgi:hypothetical protein